MPMDTGSWLEDVRSQLRSVVGLVRRHRLARSLHDPADPRFADEHVVRFLGQHEPARARERIEARLR